LRWRPAAAQGNKSIRAQENCLTCHFGIEEMHPWEPLTCTDCHGGDPKAETAEAAHVKPKKPLPADERVLPIDWPDLEYLRFKNPSDLRVIDQTCATCHRGMCDNLERSLHGTTAGHLSDGMYECGVYPARGSRYAMYAIDAPNEQPEDEGVKRLFGLPSFDKSRPRDQFASHYLDLAPKNCVRCHLYSSGHVREGSAGFDGDYRSQGCAACHVTYADNGLSQSGDPTVNKFEAGHPLTHQFTAKIPTETCTRCHYGDASIGLNFRGLAQLYPGQPAGPEVPGTTDAQLNRTFYIDDPMAVPPDVHHEKGMHCIDCHTVRDVMGDGVMYGNMPEAIEIECQDCHGTFTETSKLVTSRGRPLENLVKEGADVFLISKVTGRKHPVKQVAHAINPRHPAYNEVAAKAMTPDHARLECYTCHAGWSPNFFGFHFDRNEMFEQLDMMSGERTIGRVNTQEKVFATMRGLYLGFNTDRMIAPYMVGFSSMGSVYDEQGKPVLDQVMPVTAAGLSGMTLIHHQLHTTRKTARSCQDCHRNPTALGLGSPNANFELGRNVLFIGSTRGLDVFGLDRKGLGDSTPLANLPELGVVDVALKCEPLQGFAQIAYLACDNRGVQVVDLANPALPKARKFVKLADANSVVVAADRLYVACGTNGVQVFDVASPFDPKPLGSLQTQDARDLAFNWPHLYIADYVAGLVIADVTNPREPKVVSTTDFFQDDDEPNLARAVALLDVPSRPRDGTESGKRTSFRLLAGVACDVNGFKVADVTEPREPQQIHAYDSMIGGRSGRDQAGGNKVTGVAASMKVDLGSPDGAIPTEENDYFYVTVAVGNRQQGRLAIVRASNPYVPKAVGNARVSDDCRGVSLMHLYNPPFVQTFAVVTSGALVEIVDVSKSAEPVGVAQFAGLRGACVSQVESFAFDRLVDETGAWQKDISHEGSRFLSRQEIDKILRAPIEVQRGREGPMTGTGSGRGTGNNR
jgi:hypothetical protein